MPIFIHAMSTNDALFPHSELRCPQEDLIHNVDNMICCNFKTIHNNYKRHFSRQLFLIVEQKKQINFRRSLLTPPSPPQVTIPPIKVTFSKTYK